MKQCMTWPSNSLALPYRRAGLPCRWAMYSIYIYIHGWKPLYIIIYILRYFERYVWPNSYRILKPFECSTCMTLTIDHQGVLHDIQEPINIYIYMLNPTERKLAASTYVSQHVVIVSQCTLTTTCTPCWSEESPKRYRTDIVQSI
jgi:hypothetical protein